jgi:hypothetical protein
VAVFDHPNLRVMRASDRYLLAMKAAASRRNTKDLDDLAALAKRLGLKTVEDVVAVHDEVFADEPLPPRKVAVIREALGSGSHNSGRAPEVRCRVCGRVAPIGGEYRGRDRANLRYARPHRSVRAVARLVVRDHGVLTRDDRP